MPRKKHLTEEASSGAAAVLDGPAALIAPATGVAAAPAAAPAALRPADGVKERPPRPVAHDSMASVTARLGAAFWETNARFEWAKARNNHHYEFTRYYFNERVLVDVWPNSKPSARTEAERKRACVDAENKQRVKRGEKPIGLLAVERGAIIPVEYFARALEGETFPLIERATEGVLV